MTAQVDAIAALCVWEEMIENPDLYPGIDSLYNHEATK